MHDTAHEKNEPGGLLEFYGSMNSKEKRAFWACFSGWTLDGLDFMIYPLVLGTIIVMWHVDRSLAGLAATMTLLFSAIGGWLAGYASDRIGRVRLLQITILWFAVFSFICAFTTNFTQLMIARALLGLGFGGEWAAGAILMGETIRARYRGRAVGCVQAGWAIGWGLAVLSQAIVFSVLPAEQAWRVLFALGILPALLVLYLRRYVQEPEIIQQMQAEHVKSADRPSIFEIFSPGMLRTTILASLMSAGLQGGYYAITVWLPTFLKTEKKLSVVDSTSYLAFVIAGSFVGYLIGAWLADRIGRRKLFLWFSIGAIGVTLLYTQIPFSDQAMLFLGFPLGFFASGYFSGVGPFLTELYPTRLRGSGQGFTFNFGRGIGALFPTLVGFLSSYMPLSQAIAIFTVIAYGVFFTMAYALPETAGRELTDIPDPKL